MNMRRNALEIMRLKYSIFNEKVLKELYDNFLSFVNAK